MSLIYKNNFIKNVEIIAQKVPVIILKIAKTIA